MSYSLRIPRPVGRLTAAMLTAFLVSGVSTEGFAATPWVVQSSPDPGGASEPNTLAAVAATSSTNAWAVGSYTTSDGAADQTLIEHWNGTDWQVQDSPNPGGPPDSLHDNNYLLGVTAVSATEAWTVGNYNDGSNYQTLIAHWNGATWEVQPSPNPGGSANFNGLTAVAATSSSRAWAVGSYSDGATEHTLIERWNGSAWKTAASPSPGVNGSRLQGVAATSGKDAWAVGFANNGSETKTLILHWDGVAWTRVKSPNPGGTNGTELYGLTAVSRSDAWAVGYYGNGSAYQTLVLHWNGVRWKRVSSPNPAGTTSNHQLFGVAMTSSSNAWAVGMYSNGGIDKTLILHWNGTAWRRQASPNPSASDDELYGAVATSSSNAWAVGYDDNGSADETLILHCC